MVKMRVAQTMIRWVLVTAMRRRVTQMDALIGVNERL
jgi:hypothetical protein